MIFIFILIGIFAVMVFVAWVIASTDVATAKKIDCPSCGKKTLFKKNRPEFSKCRFCSVLILDNPDGTYRAHVPS